MNTQTIIELVGYLGSALVVVSMLMTSVVKLRIVNTIGSFIFMVYALIIRSYPTALMNLFLIGINVYQLLRLLRNQKHYDMIPVSLHDAYVAHLLEKNRNDIRKWFPEFSFQQAETFGTDCVVRLVCCDSNPATLFIARQTQSDELDVVLNYATPVYRDTTSGHYTYSQLKKQGFRTLTFSANAPEHVAYMEKVGYRKNEKGIYVLDLGPI